MLNSTLIRKSGIAVAALTIVALPLIGLSGCAENDPQQVQVVTGQASQQGLTPTQRGTIRREALEAAQKGFAAWQTGDVNKMKPYWSATYIKYFGNKQREYAAKGQKRVWKFNNVEQFDVSDMNNTGRQVLVDILADDQGYVAKKDGSKVTTPSGKQAYIQLTMDNKTGKWMITRLIAGNEIIQ